jgi:hypothetical protein
MVWRYGQMQPTSWDDALDLVARVTVALINDQGEDGLFVSAFDHGGAGGGYENTWGTGKLYFGAMKVKNIRIHPASGGRLPRSVKKRGSGSTGTIKSGKFAPPTRNSFRWVRATGILPSPLPCTVPLPSDVRPRAVAASGVTASMPPVSNIIGNGP